MQIVKLNETINIWIAALQDYDFDTLIAKPDTENWSLGQVYLHLISETSYYIEQIEICLAHNENCSEQMTEDAVNIFANNGFPDEKIKNHSPSAQNVPQPANKSLLLEQMLNMKSQLNYQWNKIVENRSSGKTRHPGLGYFNAREWIQFVELHLRHHLRQKGRIENSIQYVSKNGG